MPATQSTPAIPAVAATVIDNAFRSAVGNALNDGNLYIERVPTNGSSPIKYMSDNLNANPPYKTEKNSYSSNVDSTFFKLNPSNTVNLTDKVNDGVHTGYSFLFYMAQSASYRTRNYASLDKTDCFVTDDLNGDGRVLMTQIQKVSQKLSGTYTLNYVTPQQTYTSDAISAVYTTNPFDIINAIPALNNKVQLFWKNNGEEEVLYHIKVVDRLKYMSPEGFIFTPYTTPTIPTIMGGGDILTNVLTVSDFPAPSAGDLPFTNVFNQDVKPNEWIFPLTAEFMALKVDKPVVRLFNNNIEAVCEFNKDTGKNNCEVTTSLVLPQVNDWIYDPITQKVTFFQNSNAISENDCSVAETQPNITNYTYNYTTHKLEMIFENCYFYVTDSTEITLVNLVTNKEEIVCTFKSLSNDQKTIVCEVSNEIPGKYYPQLRMPYGLVNNISTFANAGKPPIQFNFGTITNISDPDSNPTCSIPSKGTSTITITGTKFPVLANPITECPLIKVTFRGSNCRCAL